MRIFKRMTTRLITLATTVAFAAVLALGAFALTFQSKPAFAEDDDTKEFAVTSVGLDNTDFSSTSGSYPASPNSWSGDYVGGGKGNIVAGVVDLTANNYVGTDSGNKKFKLDGYDEFKTDIPRTIFGTSDYPGTDAKTLLINAPNGAETVYAYKSAEMTFQPNSFYRVSAWVKTGNFAPDTGATIKLNGLGQNCSFININTAKDCFNDKNELVFDKDNKYGWKNYTIYVRTPSSLSRTVTLSLGIGDALADNEEDSDIVPRAAKGYAFFDNVKADRISAYDFAFETEGFATTDRENVFVDNQGTSKAIDLFDADYLTTESNGDTVEIGTFSDNTQLWDVNAEYGDDDDDYIYTGHSTVNFYESQTIIGDLENNAYGFTKNPWAPLGKAEDSIIGNDMFVGTNGNILMINTYDKSTKKFGTAARGVASPDVTIERFKYYRMGVWVKGDGIDGGNGISIGIKGQSNNTADNNKLDQWYNNLEGDAEDAAHYGWKEHVVYISGSVISDLTVHFEFWLGAPQSQSKGIAMFDNVTFTELSYNEYKEMTEADGSNILSLDASATDTGVSNGNFMSVGDYEEFKYPLPAAEWSYYTASTAATKGFSAAEVDTEKAVYGIIPVDDATFDKIAASGAINNAVNPATFANAPLYNTLLLSSTTKTAFCYRSPSITLSTDKAYRINIDMAVKGVTSGGYGASLVLRTTDGDVVATIENITDTFDSFKTYTFYINAPLSDKTVNVEVWLGLNDRKDNKQKLSDGNVYVKSVALEEWTAASDDTTVAVEYEQKLAEYLSKLNSPAAVKALDYAMYSFSAPTLDYFDAYSYYGQSGLGVPYQWSVSSKNNNVENGLFNSDNMKGLVIYDGFDKKDQSGNMLYIHNTADNSTTYTYGNTISLVANTYYRLDVTVKVRVSDEIRNNDTSVGASINLTGTVNESFENIKDTTTLVDKNNEDSRDYETFKTYTFYISTGSNGGEIGLNIKFGGDDRNSFIQGRLIIGDVKLTSINNTTYEDAEKSLDGDYEKAVSLSEATTDDDDGNAEPANNDIAWWIIPTVLFSACLVAGIIIILVVRLRDRAKRKKKTVYTSEYDRAKVSKALDDLKGSNDDTDKVPTETDGSDENDALTDTDEANGTQADDGNAPTETEATADDSEGEKPTEEKPAPSPTDSKNKEADDLDD